MPTATNTNTVKLAETLATTKKGSFVGIILTKKGEEKGRGAEKKLYGNDQVSAVIVTGFSYTRLCERSLAKLATLDLNALVAKAAAKGVQDKTGTALTLANFETARDELIESLQKSATGTNESTTDAVYEPLITNGQTVFGARVYVGPANPDDPRAPVPGTTYIQGLSISSRVIEPAPNGPVPPAASGAVVLAKDMLRRELPIGRYVSYALPKGGDWLVKSGGSVLDEVTDDQTAGLADLL